MHAHPFEDISIDVMGGDLPRTAKGNQYLVIILDNVSKWVHAIFARNLCAGTIADKLMEFFCLFCIARTLRMDNSSGFRSQLMTKLREKLGIETKFSAPYHYASHGGVERENQTIERMLRKFLSNYPKSWDTMIHYLTFALREVPHSGTRFSAHELVFGWKLRGLLEIARESWTSEDGAQEHLNLPTVKYLEKLQFDIQAALNAAITTWVRRKNK